MSLLNRLYDIINNNDLDSSAYNMAMYFLSHYQEMSTLNIYDVADECFSSRSSIRRFAQSIGYDNFKELKEEFPTYEELKSYHFYPLGNEDYGLFLCGSLQNVIDQIYRQTHDNPDTDRLLQMIHDSSLPMFYCCGMSQSSAQEFQRRMVFCHKIIHVSPDLDVCGRQMRASEGTGLLITITSTGNFAEQSLEQLDQIPATKVLLIASNGARFEGHFDMIYSLAPDFKAGETEGGVSVRSDMGMAMAVPDRPVSSNVYLYGSYGILYFFDLLFYRYAQRYPS